MIDTQLISEAEKCSEAVMAVDASWREYIDKYAEDLRKNVLNLPFRGDVCLSLKGEHVLIEGYVGELRIDRLYSRGKTYILKQPITHDPFKVYGVYDNSAKFRYFTAEPLIGFHYLGMDGEHIRPICTGDLKCSEPKSFEGLQQETARIVEAFKIINMESLGGVFLPDDNKKLKEIFENKDSPSEIKVNQLLEKEMIEKLL